MDLVFSILGPLQVWDRSRPVLARGTKRDVILATLLLRANQLVTVDELAETLWVAPPVSAVANIHTYVSGLRTSLPPRGDDPRIQRSRSGYLLSVEPGELDAAVFTRLVATAETAGPDEAAALLDEALELWRGQPLEGMPAAAGWRVALDHLVAARRTARLRRIRLRREVGQHEMAAGELRTLLTDDPFNEDLWRELLLTLSTGGQPAAALRAYQQARALLVGELGIEPGPALREAQAAVLQGAVLADGDVRVSATVDGPAGPGARPLTTWVPDLTGDEPWPAMWQLPPDTPDFTGRSAAVATLTGWLAPTGGGAPPVAVVTGPPGVGKTTLAVRVAHLLRDRFPDGALYLELDGTVDVTRTAADALGELLRTFGMAGVGLPESTAGRAALYRSVLAGRRVLVVLDDAARVAQVTLLLPPDGLSAVLVTSRRQLPDLPGARQLDLDVLEPAEARDLLATLIGPDRADREPSEVDAIVEACGRLPLGIRIAGARLIGRRTGWSLRFLSERLRDRAGRLDELTVGDLGVRASFDLSLRALPPPALRAFRLLGLLGPADLPGWVVGRLLAPDNDAAADAEPTLEILVDASLLQIVGPDANGQPRYRMHDLLRDFARESAMAEPKTARRAAVGRVLAGWLTLAEQAAARLPVCVFRAAPGSAQRWRPDPAWAADLTAEPLAWFDAERPALLGAVEVACGHGLDELAWELAAVAVPYLDQRGYLDDWRRGHELALTATEAAGNLRGEASMLRGLGQVDLYRDAYDQAYQAIDRSRQISRHLGDGSAEAVAIAGLGTIERITGHSSRALERYRQALGMFVAVGNRHAEAQTRNAIGAVHRAAGELDEARRWLNQALRVAAGLDDHHRVASVLQQIAELDLADGAPARALGTLRQAAALFRSMEDVRCAAYTVPPLATALVACGDTPAAIEALGEAAEVLRSSGDRRGEATITRMLSTLYRSVDDEVNARRFLRRATLLWQQVAPFGSAARPAGSL